MLIILGLAISVPIIVWGSHLVIRLVDRYPSVILLGGAVLAWTGYTMIVREPLLAAWLAAHPPARFVIAVLVFSISLAPWWTERLSGRCSRSSCCCRPCWSGCSPSRSPTRTWSDGGLFATEIGSYLVEAVRWLGWLPLAAGYVWLREQRPHRAARN